MNENGVKRRTKRKAERSLVGMEEDRPVVEQGMTSYLPLEGFRQVARLGAFRRVLLHANWTHFAVSGDLESGGCACLVTKKNEQRRFHNPAAALMVLRQMGISRVEVDMKEWDLDLASLTTRMRPDVTARRLQRERMMFQHLMPEAERETGGTDRQKERTRLEQKKHKRRFEEATRVGTQDNSGNEEQVEMDGREWSNRFIEQMHGYRPAR